MFDSSVAPGEGDDRSNVGVLDVGERMARLAGRRNVLDAEFVDEIAQVIETGAWAGDGYRSVSHWLTIQFGLSPAQARRFEDVARRIGDFPLTADQFRAGLLSLDQFRAVALHAPSWADVNTFELVQYATEPQIRRIVRTNFPDFNPAEPDTLPGEADSSGGTESSSADDADAADDPDADDTDGVDAGSAHPPTTEADLEDDSGSPFRQYFSARWTPDGRFVGSFDLAAPTGIIFDAAISEARDALFHNNNNNNNTSDNNKTDGNSRNSKVTWADALLEIARRSRASAPVERAERHKVMIHIDTTNIPAPNNRPVVALANGARLPDAIASYMCCDATARPVWETDSIPLGIGTTSRTIPDRLRRIIVHRDQGCRVPGCGATIVEIHHIQHWEDGGPTELWNLISLCSKHHQMHHDGRLNITGDPNNDSITFADRHHQPIQFASKPIPPPPPDATNDDEHQPPGEQSTSQPPPRYHKPACERLDMRWISKWQPPSESPHLTPTEQANWHNHLTRRRSPNDPPNPE